MLDMSASFLDITAALVALILSVVWYARRSTAGSGYLPLPPSPRGWPLIGNLLDVPAEYSWKAYHTFCEQLGTSILYLKMAGQHVIVLDNYEDCMELLERRSSLYSGRTAMPMINELMGWNFNFVWMDYGNTWRTRQRIMHNSFHPNAAKSFRPLQLKSARRLLPNLGENTDVVQELRQMAGETIMTLAYGLDIKPKDDPYIKVAEEGVRALLQAAVPGAFLVDMLPILKHAPAWMPGASFKIKAREWRVATENMLYTPFSAFLNETVGQVGMDVSCIRQLIRFQKEGIAKPSFSYNGMQAATTDEGGIYTEDNVRSVAGALYQTGADTTISAVGFSILSLLDRPDIARKIQEEIDLVTESTRLPQFEDENSLPYLMAFIKESMRYWSVVPLAVPHYLNTEDYYNGYRLPASSMIVPNTWAILHNEEIFPEPFTIKPERFLSGDNFKVLNAHYNCAWGYGRRACPGRYMAFASIWITMAHILAMYDISKAKDDDGNVIEPSHDVASSILLMPKDYKCTFTLRSGAASQLRQMLTLSDEVE